MADMRDLNIRFFKTKVGQPDGSLDDVSNGFWDAFVAYIDELDVEDRTFTFRGVAYEVGVIDADTVYLEDEKVIYFGKRRAQTDAPMVSDPNFELAHLAVDENHWIVEPSYLHPMSLGTTTVVSYYRTSGGAYWGAIEYLINRYAIIEQKGSEYKVLPLTRRDPLKELEGAMGMGGFRVSSRT